MDRIRSATENELVGSLVLSGISRDYATRLVDRSRSEAQASALRVASHSLSWFGAQGNTLDHLTPWQAVQVCQEKLDEDAARIERNQ